MKQFKRYFCVLSLFLLLSIVFSINVFADSDFSLSGLRLDISHTVGGDLGNHILGEITLSLADTTTVIGDTVYFDVTRDCSLNFNSSYFVYKDNNVSFLNAGETVNIKFENVLHSFWHTVNLRTLGGYYRVADVSKVLIHYYDGTFEYIDDVGYAQTVNDKYADFSFSFVPEKDVIGIEFILLRNDSFYLTGTIDMFVGRDAINCYSFDVTVDNKEVGLLGGILEWIKSIFESVKNIGSYILELPEKIWNLISEGLKSLFVPSEQFLTQFKADMDTMLSQKLGAIYEVVNILTEGWDRIQSNDITNTIEFPEVTIPLPNNNEFSFGGQSVQIVPNGFEFLVTAIKLIIGISCTALFVNGLKKRYDEIMGG